MIFLERLVDCMPIIRPISDLRSYNSILNECVDSNPVYLTKNGKGKFVVLDINEYEKQQATIKLLVALSEADQNINNNKTIDFEEIKKRFNY